jgi:cytoskeletal protein RodZ
LKTYAKVLSLNPETVIELYGKSAPQESPGQVPRPESSGKRRRSAWLIGLALVVLASLYGVWLSFPSFQVPQVPRGNERREKEPPSQPAPAEKEATPPPVASSPAQGRAAEEPPKTEPAPVQAAVQESPATPKAAESPVRDQAGEDGWLSLTGIVKERTWLRIRIDGKEEKEYLLQPGSRPQWRGKENFYMLIGNAGGIEFDLNGKRVVNLGKPGQVIRLTLPKEVGRREGAN